VITVVRYEREGICRECGINFTYNLPKELLIRLSPSAEITRLFCSYDCENKWKAKQSNQETKSKTTRGQKAKARAEQAIKTPSNRTRFNLE
jgi:hypothetical protein